MSRLPDFNKTFEEYQCTTHIRAGHDPNFFNIEIRGFPNSEMHFGRTVTAVILHNLLSMMETNSKMGMSLNDAALEEMFVMLREANRSQESSIDKFMKEMVDIIGVDKLRNSIRRDNPDKAEEMLTLLDNLRNKERDDAKRG